MRLSLGVQTTKEIQIELKQGKLASSEAATWNFDCTHNNDLVDYFKTLFEGTLNLELADLDLYSSVDIS